MIIAHDLGTTGDKASLHTDEGRLVTSATAPYAPSFGPGGMAEQDPQVWFDAVARATWALLDRGAVAADQVRAVSFSGQMMGAVLLDAAYQPVRPAMIWADHRSTEQAQRLEDALGAHRAYELLGHRVHATYSLAKVMWVREHEPENFARVRHVCLAKDFVVQRLTGSLVTDPSDASSTNAYDQRAGRWSDEVLGPAGFDAGLFPEIVRSTTVVGGVRSEVADSVGLVAGTPVVLGGGDGPLAATGAGILSSTDGCYAYLGSSWWVSMAAGEPLHDPQRRSMTFDHVVPGQFVPTATMQAGGASLEWVAEVLAPDAEERFEHLLAETADADTSGLYFLPHLLGERSPHWNTSARGGFLGLTRHHGRAHLAKAVLEGVAFNLAICLEAFRDSGRPVQQVDAIGGGALSDVWLGIIADVWGCAVRRRSIVEEANSLGAAVTAAVGAELVDGFDIARDLSEVTAEFQPDPRRHAEYAQRLEAFRDAYAAVEPWFERNHS